MRTASWATRVPNLVQRSQAIEDEILDVQASTMLPEAVVVASANLKVEDTLYAYANEDEKRHLVMGHRSPVVCGTTVMILWMLEEGMRFQTQA